MHNGGWTIATVCTGMLALAALGDEARIGERAPEIEAASWANYEGDVALSKFKERIIVLFFFRTDDSTSVDEAIPLLNRMHGSLGRGGVVFIGLTPEKKSKAESTVNGKEVQFIVGYEAKVMDAYGVSSFPQIYLIDTAGKLVDRFHPLDDLEDRIRTQMRKTPPAGADPAALNNSLRKAQKALRQKKYGVAHHLATGVRDLADEESSPGRTAKRLIEEIEEAAEKWLDDAKRSAKAEDYEIACKIVAELCVFFRGSDVADDAEAERGRLRGNRDSKLIMAKAMDNAKGELLLLDAVDHEASKRYLDALKVYREVVSEYEDTEAAKTADEAMDRITSDPQAQRAIKAMWDEEQADRWFNIGNRFAKIDMYDKAREYYNLVLDSYPQSRAAPKAKARLKKLPEGTGEEPAEDTPPPDETETAKK